MSRAPKRQGVLAIVYRKVDELRHDPQNSNKHPEKQIAQLRALLKKYGFTKPLLLKPDGKTIGAGNGIFEAAKLEGFKEVPTITISGLTAAQWRAYAIADNRVPRNSEWDIDVLRQELNALKIEDVDLGELGFGKMELEKIGVDGFAKNLPELHLGDPVFQILITCKSEKDQEKTLAKLTKDGLACKPLMG